MTTGIGIGYDLCECPANLLFSHQNLLYASHVKTYKRATSKVKLIVYLLRISKKWLKYVILRKFLHKIGNNAIVSSAENVYKPH